MSLQKQPSSVAPVEDKIDNHKRAVPFGQKLRALGVDACKFNEVKTVAIGFFPEQGKIPPSDEALLELNVRLWHQPPAKAIEATYDALVKNGKIKHPKCGSGR